MNLWDRRLLVGGICCLLGALVMLSAVLAGKILLAGWTGAWFGVNVTMFERLRARR